MAPGLSAWLLLAALSAEGPGAPAAQPAIDVAVTATAPIDAQHLADVLRAYLDEYGVRVESAAATEPGDLRRQLADARQLGQRVRAMAVVRVGGEGGGARGTVEIEIVDLATEKVLIAEVPRPQRDEDLYRALALKIQASLRATLSEAPERIGPGSGLARLVGSRSAEPPPRDPAAGRFAVETGYLLFVFPLSGVALQGLSLSGAFAPRRWLDVTVGTGLLGEARGESGGVSAAGTVVPVLASARLRLGGERVQAMLGPAAQLTYVGVMPSSATAAVRATRYVMPALGADAEARLRVGDTAWIYGRVTALGVLLGQRYLVNGQMILDTSRLQASASVGLGLSVW